MRHCAAFSSSWRRSLCITPKGSVLDFVLTKVLAAAVHPALLELLSPLATWPRLLPLAGLLAGLLHELVMSHAGVHAPLAHVHSSEAPGLHSLQASARTEQLLAAHGTA